MEVGQNARVFVAESGVDQIKLSGRPVRRGGQEGAGGTRRESSETEADRKLSRYQRWRA